MEDLDRLTWSSDSVEVSDILRSYSLPKIVKLDTGHYGNFGSGTRVDVECPFLLYAANKNWKVLAANLYWDDSQQKYCQVGQRVVLPLSYPGWFEALRDVGRSAVPWLSVEEMTQSINTSTFLVRSNVPCYRFINSDGDAEERVYSRQDLVPGVRLRAGEVYTENVRHSGVPGSCCPTVQRLCSRLEHRRYLQCRDDELNDILLEFSQRGEFSAVHEIDPSDMLNATPDVTAVYRLSGAALRRETLPRLVKLVCGPPPATPCSFTGLLRLEEVYLEQTIVAVSLGSNRPVLLEFPTDSEIHFIMASNTESVLDDEAIQRPLEYCQQRYQGYVTGIKVVQSFYPENSDKLPFPVGETEDESEFSEFDDVEETSNGLTGDDPDYEEIPANWDVDEDGYMCPLWQSNDVTDSQTQPPPQPPPLPIAEQPKNSSGSRLKTYLSDSLRRASSDTASVDDTHSAASHDVTLQDDQQLEEFLDKIFDSNFMTEDNYTVSSRALRKLSSFSTADGSFSRHRSSRRRSVPCTPASPAKKVNVTTKGTLPLRLHANASDAVESFVHKSRTLPQRIDGSRVRSRLPLPASLGLRLTLTPTPGQEYSGTSSFHRVNAVNENSSGSDGSTYQSSSVTTDGRRSPERADSGIFVSPGRTPAESWVPPDDVTWLSVQEVSRCLELIGLSSDAINEFERSQIDGKQLRELDATLLREGFVTLNALERKKVLDFVSGWRPRTNIAA